MNGSIMDEVAATPTPHKGRYGIIVTEPSKVCSVIFSAYCFSTRKKRRASSANRASARLNVLVVWLL
jgi:hypothetical protein